MNQICIYCENKEIADGAYRCGKAEYEFRDGYGPFKKGCVCIFDSDLKNGYEPMHNIADLTVEIQKEKDKYELENMKLRDEVRELKRRLTKI